MKNHFPSIRQALHNNVWLISDSGLALLVAIIEAHENGVVTQEMRLEAAKSRTARAGRIQEAQTDAGSKIAVLGIHGPIMNRWSGFMGDSSGMVSPQRMANAIRQAGNDPSVTNLVIDMDSPGGTVAGTSDFGLAVREVAKIKPVHVIANDTMASGAYWVGSAGSEVFVTDTGRVGSISAILQLYDRSKQMADAGVVPHILRTGAEKALGQTGEVITSEVEATYMRELQAVHNLFVKTVATNRGVPKDTAAEWATGRVWVGSDAVKAGLVDDVSSLGDVIRSISKKAGGTVHIVSWPEDSYHDGDSEMLDGAEPTILRNSQPEDSGVKLEDDMKKIKIKQADGTMKEIEVADDVELETVIGEEIASQSATSFSDGSLSAREEISASLGLTVADLTPEALKTLQAQAKVGREFHDSLFAQIETESIRLRGQEAGMEYAQSLKGMFASATTEQLQVQVKDMQKLADEKFPAGQVSDEDAPKTKVAVGKAREVTADEV